MQDMKIAYKLDVWLYYGIQITLLTGIVWYSWSWSWMILQETPISFEDQINSIHERSEEIEPLYIHIKVISLREIVYIKYNKSQSL